MTSGRGVSATISAVLTLSLALRLRHAAGRGMIVILGMVVLVLVIAAGLLAGVAMHVTPQILTGTRRAIAITA